MESPSGVGCTLCAPRVSPGGWCIKYALPWCMQCTLHGIPIRGRVHSVHHVYSLGTVHGMHPTFAGHLIPGFIRQGIKVVFFSSILIMAISVPLGVNPPYCEGLGLSLSFKRFAAGTYPVGAVGGGTNVSSPLRGRNTIAINSP